MFTKLGLVVEVRVWCSLCRWCILIEGLGADEAVHSELSEGGEFGLEMESMMVFQISWIGECISDLTPRARSIMNRRTSTADC